MSSRITDVPNIFNSQDNLTGIRLAATTYQNNSYKPISVIITARNTGSASSLSIRLGKSSSLSATDRVLNESAPDGLYCSGTVIIPPYYYYEAIISGGIYEWWEIS